MQSSALNSGQFGLIYFDLDKIWEQWKDDERFEKTLSNWGITMQSKLTVISPCAQASILKKSSKI